MADINIAEFEPDTNEETEQALQLDELEFISNLKRVVTLVAEMDEYSTSGDLDDIIALAKATLGKEDYVNEGIDENSG